jgi:hypothetical protein
VRVIIGRIDVAKNMLLAFAISLAAATPQAFAQTASELKARLERLDPASIAEQLMTRPASRQQNEWSKIVGGKYASPVSFLGKWLWSCPKPPLTNSTGGNCAEDRWLVGDGY